MSVLKNRPLLALGVGVFIIAVALLRLPFAAHAGAQQPAQTAAASPGADCRLVAVELDSGYGLSRTGLRPACED